MIDILVTVYTAWMEKHNLMLGSAEEHIYDETLTQEERDWIRAFCNLWEITERERN